MSQLSPGPRPWRWEYPQRSKRDRIPQANPNSASDPTLRHRSTHWLLVAWVPVQLSNPPHHPQGHRSRDDSTTGRCFKATNKPLASCMSVCSGERTFWKHLSKSGPSWEARKDGASISIEAPVHILRWNGYWTMHWAMDNACLFVVCPWLYFSNYLLQGIVSTSLFKTKKQISIIFIIF